MDLSLCSTVKDHWPPVYGSIIGEGSEPNLQSLIWCKDHETFGGLWLCTDSVFEALMYPLCSGAV